MKNKLTAFRNFVIVTAFILSSVSIIDPTNSVMSVMNTSSSKNQSLPVINILTGASTTDTLVKMINDFNANFSQSYGFTVKIGPNYFGTTSLHDDYLAFYESHASELDVIAMDVTWPAEFAQAGIILPLNDVFNTSYQAQFIQAAIETGTYNGKIYSVPWFHDSAMLYYRTDVLQYANANGIINDPNGNPPTTWFQLENWSVAMMGNLPLVNKFNLTSGFVWQGKSYEGLMCDLMEFLGATGTYTFLSSKQLNTEFKTSSGLKNALIYMRSLITSGASPQSVLNYEEEDSRAVWNDGNAIFMRNWPYAYGLSLNSSYLNGSLITGAEHNVQQFNITAMPAANETMATNGLARTSCLGGWQLGVWSYSKYKTQAKEFIMWLTAAQQQLTYFLGEGLSPTLKALYNSTAIMNSKQGYVHNFLPIFESSIPRPISPIYQQISKVLQPTINKYLAGKVSLESAISTMASSVKSVSNQNLEPPNSSFSYTIVALVIGITICIVVVLYYSQIKKRGLNKQAKKLNGQESGTYTNISKRICPVCGSKLNQGDLFCQNCGTRI